MAEDVDTRGEGVSTSFWEEFVDEISRVVWISFLIPVTKKNCYNIN